VWWRWRLRCHGLAFTRGRWRSRISNDGLGLWRWCRCSQ
jgi:hypothetical protein